ncbi:MAG: hypothetical protein WC901_03165 [Candidatus Margulisiibacteriota bacterium]
MPLRSASFRATEKLQLVIRQAGYQALFAVHVGYSIPWFDAQGQHKNPKLASRTDRHAFDQYLDRVRTRLNTTPLPLFIFQEERDQWKNPHSIEDTARWLTAQGIAPISPLVIYVPTKTNNPWPVWPFKTKETEAWGILGDVMLKLGILGATIIGEECTTLDPDLTNPPLLYDRCVGIAWSELSALIGGPARTVVEQTLTYPNLPEIPA